MGRCEEVAWVGDVADSHPMLPGLLVNMASVLTPVVSQQRSLLKDAALLNISPMLVTLDVSHGDRSLSKDAALENM